MTTGHGRVGMRTGEPLALAGAGRVVAPLVAGLLAGVALVLRAGVELPEPVAPLPQRLVPPLVALAAVCCAALVARRAPLAACLAAATGAGVATVEILAVGRGLLDAADPGARMSIVTGAAAAGLAAVGIALAYAVAPRRGPEHRVIQAAAAVAAIASLVACLGAVGSAIIDIGPGAAPAADPLGPSAVRLMNRVLLGTAALAISIGLVRDTAGAAMRARDRVRMGTAPDGPSPWLAALADELLPLRARERQRAADSERARLAADLHAIVLPELRGAAAAVELGAPPADVAAGLRRSLEGVERLMHERQSIVLEEFGLVAALEWLAERTEERTDLHLVVELELEGDRVAERDAVPPDVARAAFRVALLALDNVTRHAGARRVTIRLSVDGPGLAVAIADDGARPWNPEAERHGRGLVDMRRTAAGIGAAFEIEAGPRGTTVYLRWPDRATQNHRRPAAETAAGPEAGSS